MLVGSHPDSFSHEGTELNVQCARETDDAAALAVGGKYIRALIPALVNIVYKKLLSYDVCFLPFPSINQLTNLPPFDPDYRSCLYYSIDLIRGTPRFTYFPDLSSN